MSGLKQKRGGASLAGDAASANLIDVSGFTMLPLLMGAAVLVVVPRTKTSSSSGRAHFVATLKAGCDDSEFAVPDSLIMARGTERFRWKINTIGRWLLTGVRCELVTPGTLAVQAGAARAGQAIGGGHDPGRALVITRTDLTARAERLRDDRLGRLLAKCRRSSQSTPSVSRAR